MQNRLNNFKGIDLESKSTMRLSNHKHERQEYVKYFRRKTELVKRLAKK
jgi:hypothetical protein